MYNVIFILIDKCLCILSCLSLADRSTNDLTQYPVVPWVLSNYTSEELGELYHSVHTHPREFIRPSLCVICHFYVYFVSLLCGGIIEHLNFYFDYLFVSVTQMWLAFSGSFCSKIAIMSSLLLWCKKFSFKEKI